MKWRWQGRHSESGPATTRLDHGVVAGPVNFVGYANALVKGNEIGVSADQGVLAVIDHFVDAGVQVGGGASAEVAAAFDELIRDLSDSLDLTVFMITHDLDSLYAVTDRVAVLADRKVVGAAPVGELEHSNHPWIQEYFLGPRGRAARARRARTEA